MASVIEALNYPRRGEGWIKTTVTGGLLLLLSALLVPLVLVVGYFLRVVRAAVDGDGPPDFGGWRELASDGVRGCVIALSYLSLTLALVAMSEVAGNGDDSPDFDGWSELVSDGVRGYAIVLVHVMPPVALAAAIAGSVPSESQEGTTLFMVLFLGAAVLELATYVGPAALANYAVRGSIRAGFEPVDLLPVLTSWSYFVTWLKGVSLVTIGLIVFLLLNVVPLLGTVVGAGVAFYTLTSAGYLFGSSWVAVHGADAAAEDAASPVRDPSDAGIAAASVASAVRTAHARAVRLAEETRPWTSERELARAVETGTVGPPERAAGSSRERTGRRGVRAVADVAERPVGDLDADAVATLIAALDADPEVARLAAPKVRAVAAERPELLVEADAIPALRDLRLAEDSAVQRAAETAIQRLDDAGLY